MLETKVDDQLRLDLLREALPYIQRFKGQTFVVKLSGKVTEDQENLTSLAEELALLQQVGIRICVVHGGGKQLTELAKKLGIELKQVYLTSGEHDLLLIVESPSGDNVAKFALATGALGNVRTSTTRAWSESEWHKLISELP